MTEPEQANTAPQELKSLEEFLFGAPLYKIYTLPDDLYTVRQLYNKTEDTNVDGHCPHCHRASTFIVTGASLYGKDWSGITTHFAYDEIDITCVRDEDHVVRYYFRIENMTLEKIGQFPSLATISNDEVFQYRTSMTEVDGQEFHKAIGLAAHGVGVGSFVYLRPPCSRRFGAASGGRRAAWRSRSCCSSSWRVT